MLQKFNNSIYNSNVNDQEVEEMEKIIETISEKDCPPTMSIS